ncbi:MAG: response regulator [Nannocystaceae bacterium]|nr:response regulator [Nannocystaceae bacterium]
MQEQSGAAPIRGRILVVDDEVQIRRVIRKVLSAEGYDVLEANGGNEALETLAHTDVDTVLLDMRMPDMTGIEVCKRMRSTGRHAHTPVVFLSGASERSVRREAREAGADDFLAKPFDEGELRARIRNSVAHNRHSAGMAQESARLRIEVDGQTRALHEARIALDRARRELEAAQVQTIERLTKAAEFRDDETAAHLQRMSEYSRLLARKVGLDDYTSEMIRTASPMHDVGKIGIPDSILLKPGRLTPDEYEVMKKHAEIGYRILGGSESKLLQLAASIAHTHHEKYNGSGYPRGLKGDEIPIEGRIVAVADVFDALTSERPYKKAWPLERALKLLVDGRNEHFDAELVDLFIGSMDEVLEIRKRLSDDAGATPPS